MRYKKLLRSDYCYWCQKFTRVFYGEVPKTIEYRGRNISYNEITAFCKRCHRQAKYELGGVWDANLERIKNAYNEKYKK